MTAMTKPVDGIDPRLLWVVRGVSLMAYTGVIFMLPPILASRAIALAERAGQRIIGDSLLAWADEIIDGVVDDVLDVVIPVVDHVLGETAG